MSALSATSLQVGGLPPIDPALEPAAVRNGDAAAKKAYATGLAFEEVLMNELAQEMAATVPGLDDGLGGSTDTGSDSGSDGAGGLTGSGSGLGAYSSLLPQTLSTSIMQAGGTGIAMQIATSIDPALADAKTS